MQSIQQSAALHTYGGYFAAKAAKTEGKPKADGVVPAAAAAVTDIRVPQEHDELERFVVLIFCRRAVVWTGHDF